ncbi:ectopic P granules protein 5 homolog [Anopheles ziemanni]|uniref:ectopic P granules protein 5 homolog n=1 Tax=Anopheles ziemanni TaxID=345580 RepID=UPI0026602380|nr:ectopic P granules protein 5 homolog [Anopheles ziemanni]
MDLLQKLKSYGRLHHQLTGPFVEQRKTTQGKLTHLEDEIWSLEERVFEATGVCQDRREVKAKVKRTFAVYDGSRGESVLQTLSTTLDEQIKGEKAASMERQYLRTDLQHYFARTFGQSDYEERTDIITVLAEVLRIEAASQSCTLRESCPYQRDLRSWFRFVCGRFTQNANIHYRLFVLCQVLRLPGGIKSWAVDLVQFIPIADNLDEALTLQELRKTLTLVDVMMRPVVQRNSLFRSAGALDEEEQFTWVDSDGEGEDATVERMLHPLTEDDMNALLDQLPISTLMQTLKKFMLNTNCLYGIVTAAEFTQTLLTGCSTYGSLDRYRNFTKRLGRLIDHTVSYTNWLLEEPLRRAQLYPLSQGHMVVEYNKFFYETVSELYRVRTNALWQYLVSLPFDKLTQKTVGRIFNELISGQLGESSVLMDHTYHTRNHEQPENVLKELGNDEFYYVLMLMTNIAVAQKVHSDRFEFVCKIADTLMKLLITVDPCEQLKIQYVLDQLRVMISNYPQLISTGLQLFDWNRSKLVQSESVELQDNLLAMFSADNLPLRQWTPNKEDMDVLLSWFECFPLAKVLHKVAAHLLCSIYYGENSSGQLAVPREWQLEMVRKIVVTCRRLAETIYVDKSAPDYLDFAKFEIRCRTILMHCRVHAMDQPTADVQRTLQDPARALDERFVRHLSDEPTLHSGIAARCSVSSLAALLITTTGHWVPIFCLEGLPLLKTLYTPNDPRFVIRCLELVVPLVASCPWSLTGNDQFLQLMRPLIQQDSNPPASNAGRERPSLRAMVLTQISQYRRYGFLSPAVLVKFWSECIVRASKDIATDLAGLSLLNEVACSALKHRDAWAQMRQTLTPMLKDPANPPRRTRPLVDKIASMFSPVPSPPALFLEMSVDHIALVLLALEIEHDQMEVKTGLWPELLYKLDADSSLAIQPALAQVGAALQLQYTPVPHMLVLYKAARVISQAEPAHPLFPLLCQRFFTILLARHEKDVPVYGVADRLLTVDVPLVVDVKKRLHWAEAHYANLQRDSSSATGRSVRALYARLQSTFQMFAHWLADRQLNGMSAADLDRLPAQYCVPRLKMAFAGKQDLWLDLVDSSVQTTKESQAQKQWIAAYRKGMQLPAAGALADCTAAAIRPAADKREAVFQRRLEGYNKPAPIPEVTLVDMKLLQAALNLPFNQRTELILSGLRKIDQHTERLYWRTIAEFKRLKQEILEKTKILYTNEPGTAREHAKCSIMCEGAGTVHIPVQVATRNEHIVQRLEDDRRDLASTVEAAIYLPPLVMDEIVQCRMLWKSLLLDLTPNEEKSVLCNKMACMMKLLRTAFEMLREDSADHLNYAVKDSFLQCFKSYPELAYTEVATLLKTTFKQRRKPPTTVTDLLHVEDIPMGPMKAIYDVLTTCINRKKQALFIQLFGADGFDISHWLTNANADASDIASFITFTSRPLLMEGEDSRGGTEAAHIYERFYRIVVKHTILLAFHAFPVNFCPVLMIMLTAVCGKTATSPMILQDLVNVIRIKLDMAPIFQPMADADLRVAHWEMATVNSASKEPLIRMADSVIEMLTKYFGNQRGKISDASGLYPHYQHRVMEVASLFSAFAHIYCMEQAKHNNLRRHTLNTVCGLFEPWLVPYTVKNAKGDSWLIMPWNNEGAKLASHMLNTMVQVFLSMMKMAEKNSKSVIDSDEIIFYVLQWYSEHFSGLPVTETVLQPVHAALLKLPWDNLLPASRLVSWLNNVVKLNKPEQIKFALRHDEQLEHAVAKVLGDIAQLPWANMPSPDLETVIDYYTFIAQSSIVLRSPTAPHRQLNEALIELLEVVSGVSSNSINPLKVDSDGTVKRAVYIRTAMRQLAEVAAIPNKTAAVTNVKLQVAETMRTILGIVIRPLKAVLPEDNTDAHVQVQLREARALLTAMVMGIREHTSLHQPFSTALIELLTSDTHASIRKPLAHGLLGVMKLFAERTANLMALMEVTLFSCLNASANVVEGGTISWEQALELVSEKVAKIWAPPLLAGEGHVLCLQLHFLAHWRDAAAISQGTSAKKHIQLRQLLRHIKNVNKETDVYHIYPLWVTMMYGLLTLAPTTDTAFMNELVENFREYLSLIGQQCSPRGWFGGFMHTLMAGKKIPAVSHRTIALGLNCCISIAYRTLQATEKEGSDSGAASVDPTDTLRSLTAEPDAVPLREQIEELVESLPPQLELDATMALAVKICNTFDSRAAQILSTVLHALGGH